METTRHESQNLDNLSEDGMFLFADFILLHEEPSVNNNILRALHSRT